MNRSDIVLGHYVFCAQHYRGQGDALYERLCRISEYFDPGRAFSETRFFDRNEAQYEDAREVYRQLCDRHGTNHGEEVVL